MRLLLGFCAGALAHLIFQGALGFLLRVAQLAPAGVWSLAPTGPLGVPVTLNNMFWDGLWGIVYAISERRLTRRFGVAPGGLLFGFAPLLVFWFVVLPLKGAGIGGGFEAAAALRTTGLDLAFGLGTALIFRCLVRLALSEPNPVAKPGRAARGAPATSLMGQQAHPREERP